MKFDTHDYWKNKHNLDVFIRVKNESHLEDGAVALDANWMIQGNESFWAASDTQIFVVKPGQVDDWEPYQPKGQRKLFL